MFDIYTPIKHSMHVANTVLYNVIILDNNIMITIDYNYYLTDHSERTQCFPV